MKLLVTLASVLAFAMPAKAAEPFTDGQVAGLVVLGALTYQDYRQTLDIKNYNWTYEHNVFMGKRPSDSRIRNYFAGVAVVGVSAAYLLPSKYRKYAIGAGLVLEFAATEHNKRVGLKGVF